MNNLEASELVLNPDGSVYHLNLFPDNISNTIITVGDPDRVEKITHYFDSVEFKTQKREFHTQTGLYRGKRITVVSTGIGTDNIDIVLNELDALANSNLKTRKIKEKPISLDLIRIGTSGAIQPEIPVDSFVLSEMAVGLDSLLHYYENAEIQHQGFNEALQKHLQLGAEHGKPYVVSCNEELAGNFCSSTLKRGITATNTGFYGPQGRVLRLPLRDKKWNEKMKSFRFGQKRITNLEMETSGIYGLAKLMGHRAVSLNAIIANRATGEFSSNSTKTIDDLIQFTLQGLISGSRTI